MTARTVAGTVLRFPGRVMRRVLIALITGYRAVISPLYGNVCRYHPSCSAYGLRAVEVHGALKGTGLAAYRILRCNPFTHGGYDPVPGTPEADAWAAEQAHHTDHPAVRPSASPTRTSTTTEQGH